MTHPFAVSLVGITLGLIFFLPFHLFGRLLSRQNWAVGQVFALVFFGSILSLTSLYGSSIFAFAVLLALVIILATQWKILNSAVKYKREGLTRLFAATHSRSTDKLVLGSLFLAVLLLGIDFFWTSLPFYRYDQWNYHLSVSKILANSWTAFPDQVFEDHIYFTGFYEYLFLLPRLFVGNDFYNQSISNVFTWLQYVTLTYGALKMLLCDNRPETKIFMTVSSAVLLFSTPHREALTNAKPEALLIPIVMICLVLLQKICLVAAEKGSSEFDANGNRKFAYLCLAFGCTMTLPLALKITWIHPAAALGFTFAFCFLFNGSLQKKQLIGYTSIGVGIGLLAGCIPLIKNDHFFGNPLHPFQGVFHSSRWSDFMAFHWERDNRPAHTLTEYAEIIKILPKIWFDRIFWLFATLLPLLFVVVYTRWRHAEKSSPVLARKGIKLISLLVMASLLLFSIIWPLAGNPLIQPRYALSGLGFVFVLVCYLLWEYEKHQNHRAAVYMGLLIPLLAQSKADLSLKSSFSMIASKSVESFYKKNGKPYDILEISQMINQDRDKRYSKPGPYEHIVITDTPMGYFLESIRLRASYYDYEYLKEAHFKISGRKCLSDFLIGLNANYIIHYEKDYYPLPSEILNLLKHATELTDEKSPLPKAFHIETARLEGIRNQDPNCN